MDGRLQELERRAQAENDGLLAYRLIAEKQRLNLFDDLKELEESGTALLDVERWKIVDAYEPSLYITIVSYKKLVVTHRPYNITLEYDGVWVAKESYKYDSQDPSERPMLGLVSDRVNAFFKKNRQEFLRRARLISLKSLKNYLAQEKAMLESLEDIRRKAGESYLAAERTKR